MLCSFILVVLFCAQAPNRSAESARINKCFINSKCMQLVPIMLFVAVEGGYLCHFLIGEGEVEDADVLLYVVGIA